MAEADADAAGAAIKMELAPAAVPAAADMLTCQQHCEEG